MHRPFFASVTAVIALCALIISVTVVHAAINIANRASGGAERGIQQCGNQFAGQTSNLNKCIARELNKLSKQLKKPDVPDVAPKASRQVASAASKLRPKRSKKAGVAVMNRARSVLRALAAKSSGQTRRVYDRVSRVFTVAINVINSKG